MPETADISNEYDISELGTLPDIEGALFNMRYLQGYVKTIRAYARIVLDFY